tara:strand:- start:1310 stop:2836 length:1527 start_codon:yes stop_codon:yes gene_type:complete
MKGFGKKIKSSNKNETNSLENRKNIIANAIKLHSEGKTEEASKYYRYCIDKNYNETIIYSNYAIILKNQGNLKKAESFLNKALELNPYFEDAHLNLGSLYEESGQLKKAEISTNNAIKINPSSAKAHYNLSNILKAQGLLEKARQSIQIALKLDPNFAIAHLNLGSILKEIGNLKEAELSTLKAIELYPNFAEAYSNLGNILEEAGNINEAKKNWIKAISLLPSLDDASLQLAKQLYFERNYKLAIKYLKGCKSNQCQTLLLGCLLCMDDEKEFYKTSDILHEKRICNADIGGIIQHANCIYENKINSNFCNNSIDYIAFDKINNDLFPESHLNQLISYVKSDISIKRYQTLLENGMQTSGNLFSLDYTFIDSLKKALELKIESYKMQFKDSNEGFINYWPNNYELRAWIVSMKSGGFLNQHNHEYGWITGSFYLQIPNDMEHDQAGSIAFSYQGPNYPVKNKNFNLTIKRIKKRDLFIFPSSLFHRTIPFKGSEDRICFVFDLIQKN